MILPKTPDFRLDGRRALVTGAGRGIGLALAAALAEAGAEVTLVASFASEGHGEARSRRPRAGAELTVAELAWPATTRSVQAKSQVWVYDRPSRDQIGLLAKGTRVAWTLISFCTPRRS